MKKKITSATLAAVMTLGMMSNFTVSAESLTAQETQKTSFAEVDGKKEYDEAEWEAFKRAYWDWDTEDTEGEYNESENRLKIRDDGLIYDSSEVVGYIGRSENLVIPKKIDGNRIFRIKYGLNNLKTIKTLTIEAEIEEMGSQFYNCPNLEKVVLPDSLKYIRSDSFEDLGYDDCNAFSNCPKLKEVYLPDSLKLVFGACFENTPWLEEREKEEGLVIICGSLLSGRKAEGKVVIPNTVTYVCYKAFYDNDKMTELVVSANSCNYSEEFWTTNIVFRNCTALNKITYKNGSIEMIDFMTKEAAPNLKKVILPPSFDFGATQYAVEKFDQPTYYYYKGTPAAAALESKEYSYAKKAVLPGKTKSFKAAAKRKAIKTSWKTVSTATGYQIQVSPDNNFKNNVTRKFINNNKKTTYTFKNLRSGVKYYVRLRTYKTFDGKKYYGKYTKVRSIITKY